MDLNRFKRKALELKSKHISIRISPMQKRFLDKHKISPTKVFDDSLRKLQEKKK